MSAGRPMERSGHGRDLHATVLGVLVTSKRVCACEARPAHRNVWALQKAQHPPPPPPNLFHLEQNRSSVPQQVELKITSVKSLRLLKLNEFPFNLKFKKSKRAATWKAIGLTIHLEGGKKTVLLTFELKEFKFRNKVI